MTGDEIRAARALLGIDQCSLAGLAQVSLSTLKRVERGASVGSAMVDDLRRALEREGVVVVPPGTLVMGRPVEGGVVLVARPGRYGNGSDG